MSAHSRGGRDGQDPRAGQDPGAGQDPRTVRDHRATQDHRAGQDQESGGTTAFLWAALVIAAALIGGLAAAALVHTSLVIAVIVAIVAGGIAVAVFRYPAHPDGRRDGHSDGRPAAGRDAMAPGQPRPAAYPASAPATSSAPVTSAGPVISSAPATVAGPVAAASPTRGQTETAVQLLPLPADNSSRSAPPAWWDAAQGAPPPSSSAAQRAPAPDLSTYLASTFIAQCPRCGAFRLDITRARSGLDFRCESCDYVWTWQPGTPWPPVRVMPGRRKESRPPAP